MSNLLNAANLSPKELERIKVETFLKAQAKEVMKIAKREARKDILLANQDEFTKRMGEYMQRLCKDAGLDYAAGKVLIDKAISKAVQEEVAPVKS